PALQHGYWGVVVKSLERNETLFAVNARKLMLPASSMKVVTLAAAAEKRGWEFRYETTLHAAGRVVGDDNRFEDETLGFGWSWDDLPDDYAAGVGALQFNENAVRVTVTQGPAAGDSAAVSVAPAGSGLNVTGNVVT